MCRMPYFPQLGFNVKCYILQKLYRKISHNIIVSNVLNNKFGSKMKIAEKIAKEHILFYKPLSKIFKEKWFFGYKFFTNKYTLDPRHESELIVEKALEIKNITSVLDLGTGTGCLIIALYNQMSKNNLNFVAIDNNIHCLHVAKKNAKKAKIKFLCNNWLKDWNEPMDLLISNPPYLSKRTNSNFYDPKYALINRGNFYEQIAQKQYLFKHIILEINYLHHSEMKHLFPKAEFLDEYVIYINNE